MGDLEQRGSPSDPDPDTIKMFVGQIPRNWNEPECRSLFEKYGPVFSLNILRDKMTQTSKGCCFVTYYHRKDAIDAQGFLHNIHTIEGMHHPVQMKPADTENRNERKLFIGQLSKKHTEEEVRTLFLRFGHIEDCSVLRDSDGRSRGCAFVTFSTRNCAVNATKEMHHSQTMEGCTAPLVVKFADTQKDKDTKSRTPTLGSSGPVSNGSAMAATNQQAAILQQLSGGANGINLHTLSTLAALLQGGQQTNMLGLLGGVLSALGKLTSSSPESGGSAGAAVAAPVSAPASTQPQLAALFPQLQVHGQGMEALAQMQQVQLAQQQHQQQQQLLAMLGQQQAAQEQANNLAAYQQYQGAHVVAAATTSAPGHYGVHHQQQQPIYQNANGMYGVHHQQPIYRNVNAMMQQHTGSAVKAVSPAATYQQPTMAHLAANGVDPLQQAIQQYALTSMPGIAVQASVGVGNGDVKGPDGSNLFIYHLPQDFGDSDLMSTFAPFGRVLSAKVFVDKVTNLSKCFGFVSYDNALSAHNAIAAMNGFKIGSKRLKVELKGKGSHPYTKIA